MHSSCETLSTSSVDAITAVNDYVDAFNRSAADAEAKTGPAVDGLNHSADLVARSVSDPLTPELKDAMNAWVDAARGGSFQPLPCWPAPLMQPHPRPDMSPIVGRALAGVDGHDERPL